LLPYLTRVLGVEGFGELSLNQAYIAFILIFVSLNVDGAISRYFFRYGQRSVYLVFCAGLVFSVIITLLGVLISVFLGYYLLSICFICSFFQNLVNIQLTYRQIQKKALPYLCIQFLISISSVVITLFILTFILETYQGRIYAVTLSFFITSLITSLFVPYGFYFARKINFNHFKLAFHFILTFGFPLILHNLSLFFKGQLDRLLVYNFYSSSELGIYATSFQLVSVLSVLFLALNRATLPYYFEALKDGSVDRKAFKKLIFLSLIFVPFPSLIALILPESLYELIIGAGFGNVKDYCVIFLLGISMTLPYYIVVNYLFYIGDTKAISLCSILSAIVHVLLLISIGAQSLMLASFCLFLTNLFTFLYLYIYTKNKSIFLEHI
jgi:O-antigen/teichoic acid export membrane protein